MLATPIIPTVPTILTKLENPEEIGRLLSLQG